MSGRSQARIILACEDGSLLAPVLLFCASLLFIFALHPRLGVRDVDGYAYIMGAHSIHRGLGYRSLTGEAFNTWPPGYSLLLSPFDNSLRAAIIVNYLSYATAVSLIYYLARLLNWTWQAGLGLSIALASGFFRLLASAAHADMLTYALFFTAICLIVRGPARTLSGLIWGVLLPVKLISIVFLPASILADGTTTRPGWRRLFRSYIPSAIATSIAMAGVLSFNFFTTRTWTGGGHAKPSLIELVSGARMFLFSLPRSFLFSWYGPVNDVAFVLSMVLVIICLSSLRSFEEGRWLRNFGGVSLVISGLLLCVRNFDPTARLLGYGLITLILGFRPVRSANTTWLLYGLFSLVIGVINGISSNSLGSNDPRYAMLAVDLRPYYTGSDIVATNSFHILDLHAGIPSIPVSSYIEADLYKWFFWVTLPQFDSIATSVWKMPHPGKEWCKIREFTGGVVFAKCK